MSAAFPSPGVIINGGLAGAQEGMTLRDYFAAKFLQGCAACPTQDYQNYAAAAKDAYQMADAMLVERAQ